MQMGKEKLKLHLYVEHIITQEENHKTATGLLNELNHEEWKITWQRLSDGSACQHTCHQT